VQVEDARRGDFSEDHRAKGIFDAGDAGIGREQSLDIRAPERQRRTHRFILMGPPIAFQPW
jgi:hypothetical protein